MSTNLPKSVDLCPLCPPIVEDGDLGASSSSAWVFVVEFIPQQSKEFIYFKEKKSE